VIEVLIDAVDAARRLGIKLDTLYAYVSRGLVRSVVTPGKKERRYYAVDVERLKRGRRKGGRTQAPSPAFDRFAPVLDTSLCFVEDGRLYYRGIDAIDLAERASLEDVAALLWGVEQLPEIGKRPSYLRFSTATRTHLSNAPPLERAKNVLLQLAMNDVVAFDTSLPVVTRVGRLVVSALAESLTGRPSQCDLLHLRLAGAWKLSVEGADLIRRCLVLSADHELNPSTYVARCVASTGANPHAVVLAALCSFSGPRHGGHLLRVEDMLSDLVGGGNIKDRIRERWRRGERLIGYGHPLYPDGDPRARALLDTVRRQLPNKETAVIFDIAAQESEMSGRAPTVDYALAAISVLLGLPRGSAQGLFLIGRSVGWIAHAVEQYGINTIIRPRARYIGPLPLIAT
jgi:citrate synthase